MKLIKPNSKLYLVFLTELFYILTGALLIFGLMELLRPRIVLAFININWVLILWLAVGMLVLQLSGKYDD